MKNPEVALRHGSTPLRPRARLIQAIGEDLISNPTIALIELIKNSYDADASLVEIEFEPPLQQGKGAIVVKDDGQGMSLAILQSSWMQPATAGKKLKRHSAKGRRVTGEKGLGRFAAARLASRLHVESVARQPHNKIVADFDWDSFHDEESFLDQISCDWQELRVGPRTKTGTILRLEDLRDTWDKESFRHLRAELSRLIVQHGSSDQFSITLNLPPAYEEMTGTVTLPAVLGYPHYQMSGSIDNLGILRGEITVNKDTHKLTIPIKLKGGRKPQCGAFSFDFKVWERDDLSKLADTLESTVRDLKRDLDEAAGISIYRDSFRVLPYGGLRNDWLRLDLRRIQSPTMRLSNNQIVGAIYITADENPLLRDQTNREGLVETRALNDLRESIVFTLAQLEKFRYVKKRSKRSLPTKGSLFSELDLETIKSAILERYPGDTVLIRLLQDREKKIKSSVKNIKEVIVRYRRLATLGQLIDVILHDGRTPVAAISNESELGLRDIERERDADTLRIKVRKHFQNILRHTEILAGLFRRISPFGGRKRGKPTITTIEEIIAESFAIFNGRMTQLGIKTELPRTKTELTVDAAEMQQVLVNLIDNSLHWLETMPQGKREIEVLVARINGSLEILFSDSGPGVPDDVRDFIFDPYFTTKPDGVGLGLTIAGEIVEEYDGSLELVSPGTLNGATFRIVLKRRINAGADAE